MPSPSAQRARDLSQTRPDLTTIALPIVPTCFPWPTAGSLQPPPKQKVCLSLKLLSSAPQRHQTSSPLYLPLAALSQRGAAEGLTPHPHPHLLLRFPSSLQPHVSSCPSDNSWHAPAPGPLHWQFPLHGPLSSPALLLQTYVQI